jgi:hypothetical protein
MHNWPNKTPNNANYKILLFYSQNKMSYLSVCIFSRINKLFLKNH